MAQWNSQTPRRRMCRVVSPNMAPSHTVVRRMCANLVGVSKDMCLQTLLAIQTRVCKDLNMLWGVSPRWVLFGASVLHQSIAELLPN